MIPVQILKKEVSVLYHAKRMGGYTERSNGARLESNDLLQCRWDDAKTGVA